MTVVIISHDIQTPGREIAAATAAHLDLGFISRDRLEQRVAERMQARSRSLIGWERCSLGRTLVARHAKAELAALVSTGNVVIQAWDEASLLCRDHDVIKVYVCAGPAARVAGWLSSPMRAALGLKSGLINQTAVFGRLISKAPFVHRETCCDQHVIVLDTAQTPISECVEQICRLAAPAAHLSSSNENVPPPVFERSDEVDMTTAEVEIGSDRVRLRGAASTEQAIAAVERHLRGKRAPGDGSRGIPMRFGTV